MSDEERGQSPPPDPSRARPRESMSPPTDAEIMAKLRIAAYNGAATLAVAAAPLPSDADPRDPAWAPYFDPRELNRMQSAGEKAVAAWAKVMAPDATKPPPELPDATARRQALMQLLRDNPAALQEIAAEAGVEIRRVR